MAHNPHPDGEYIYNDPGNYIEIDHGGGVITRYAHLSRNGFAVSMNDSVSRGQRIANSDCTGWCNGDHLHFAVRINGSYVDPYAGTTQWVSADPIPMGYRDQNGNVQGPFTLYGAIGDRWLALDGAPGSPISTVAAGRGRWSSRTWVAVP